MPSPKEFLFHFPAFKKRAFKNCGLSFPTPDTLSLSCPDLSSRTSNSGNRWITVLGDTSLLETAVVYILYHKHILKHIICMCTSVLYACMHVYHMYTWYLWRSEEGIGSSGTGVTNQLFMSWEDEPGLSEKAPGLLTAAPAFHPITNTLTLWKCSSNESCATSTCRKEAIYL